jgi:DNA topoisomerase-3
MTARWETELDAISQRKGSYNGFMQPLQVSLHELIAESQAVLPEELKNIKVSKAPYKKRRSGKTPKKARAMGSSSRKTRQRVTN